jgi:hypothetical protein
VRFLILNACEEDMLASSFENVFSLIRELTPCPNGESQVSTRILNLSIITHHQPSSLPSSSSSSSPSSINKKFPKKSTQSDDN